MKGIKAAAAVWITGAIGLAIGTSYWLLEITVGITTALIMFISDAFPDQVPEEKQDLCRERPRAGLAHRAMRAPER